MVLLRWPQNVVWKNKIEFCNEQLHSCLFSVNGFSSALSPTKKRQPKTGGKRKLGRARASDSDSDVDLSVSDGSDVFEARITTG